MTEVDLSVYFCRCDHLVPVTRSVELADLCCSSAVELLLAGPSAMEQYAGYGSELPARTVLLSAGVEAGVARVDISSAFLQAEGSLNCAMGLGQLIYTVTGLSQVDGLELFVQGEPVRILDGLVLPADPVSRADYDALVPEARLSAH